ncbi:MAG TPA: Hsp70 family protein [Burkholderiales bacterium]|nr:Hsp70 family protein [Burkholderiales bacterium]
MSLSCGVDFGTSNSALAAGVDGDVSLIDLEHGEPTIPSAIFFDAETSRVSFGRHAIRNYVEGAEGRLMRALKSILGSSLVDETTYVEGRAISYRDVIAAFLRHLKTVAESDTNEELTHVVMGRPVFFVDDDPARDKAAQETLHTCARSVGFEHVEFELEPIAAALDFETTLARETLALVVDIGGGTADFSVVRLGPEAARKAQRHDDVLANLGVHIGGTDFDQLLSLHCVMPLLGYKSAAEKGGEVPSWAYFDLSTWHRINLLQSSKTLHEVKTLRHFYVEPALHARLVKALSKRLGHLVLGRVEEAKIRASGAGEGAVSLDEIEAGLCANVDTITLEQVLAQNVASIVETARRAVTLAGVRESSIATLYFTGGSAALPALRRSFAAAFPGATPVFGDPFGSVAKGLGVRAATLFR